MTLPNYFFADLPPEAELSPAMVREACFALKQNRANYLAPRSTASVIKVLATVAENWLDPDYPFRQMALEQGPAATGFSRATLVNGLESFFARLTRKQLTALVIQDLGQVQRLDEPVASAEEAQLGQAAMACGPELLAHITAGNLPNPALMSIVLGLLVRSAQFVKCARGTSLLPRLFAHSLYDAEPKLAACLEIAEWPGGTTALEEVLFRESNCVTATGSDEALDAIRRRLPPRVRFLGYGHRVSFGYITKEMLSRFNAKKLAQAAARDIAAWNQLGCLSPQVVYVETGGSTFPDAFAELLAQAMDHQETVEPRGTVPVEVATEIASLRSFFEIRALDSTKTRLWASPESTAWTVIYEEDSRFHPSCLYRCAFVKATEDLTEVLHQAEPVRGKVSTVGLAASGTEAPDLVRQLAHWGVTRVCPLGEMQNPPLTWRHDGRPALGDLITWTHWER